MNEPLFNIDLNQLPNDQEGVIELDEYPKEIGGSMHCHEYIELNEFGKKKDDLVENEIEPFIGRCFLSEEEAFICYKKYASANGFSIKKYRTDKKKGEVKRHDYCCQYEGKAPLKLFDPSKEQRNRISVKCRCKARMRITLRKSCDIFPQEWQVAQFVREHNHELLTTLEVRFLPANRIIIKEDEDRILLLKEGGLSVKLILRIMELEKGIDHGYVPFFEKDVRNLFTRVRKEHGTHDAADLLQHCKIAKEENVKFQYAFTVDEEKKLELFFWSPAHCFDWYQKYGDVVVLDTTYKVNTYQMPFGIFVGIDNHGKTILFACALLRNEKTSSFRWLMKTFVSLMKKHPKTILTDQDPWMTKAIADELPTTKHSFCIWHITSKFSGWFTAILQDQYQSWCADFYKLYRIHIPEEFEHGWPHMVAKYHLHDNKHIVGLYEIKHFWVPAYLHNYFFGGMTTTGRSKSINAYIKRFISSHTNLEKFIRQVDLAIENVQEWQLHNTMLQKYRGSALRTMSPLEKQACGVLTPFCFEQFQEEFGRATLYSLVHESSCEFVVKYHDNTMSKTHKVFWDGETTTCSCKHFEFWGILCRHIISVFLHKDCYKIPSIYLPSRRCREQPESEEVAQSVEGSPRLDGEILVDKAIDDIQCPPISITKGRPKTKRLKGGKEAGKVTRSCGWCRKVGHNITTCPDKENVEHGIASQRKKKKISSSEMGLNLVFSLKY